VFLDSWGGYGHADGQFVAPADVVVNSAGDAYVSDTFDNRLERFSFGPSTPPAPLPAPAAPAPRPRLAAPRLTLKVARRQRVLHQHGAKVTLRCASTCRVVVTAKGLRLRTITVTLHAKHTAHRKLALTKPARRALSAALRRHRHITVRLTATARSAAGPSGASTRTARIAVTG
jgi:hypothetical protein